MVIIMARRRAKRKKSRAMRSYSSTLSQCRLAEWLLVILGGLGLTQALGYIDLGLWYFDYVWSVLVLVIGIKTIIDKSC